MRSLPVTVLLLPTSNPSVCGFIHHSTRSIYQQSPTAAADKQPSIASNPHTTAIPRKRPTPSLSSSDQEENVYLDDESSYAFFQPRSTPSLSTPDSSANASEEQSNYGAVHQWLLYHLPKLKPQDVKSYTKMLVRDGFDSVDLLEEIQMEDLDFMKAVRAFVFVWSFGVVVL